MENFLFRGKSFFLHACFFKMLETVLVKRLLIKNNIKTFNSASTMNQTKIW